MKNKIKWVLQKLLGYERYLFLFALYNVQKLKKGKHEESFDIFLKLSPPEGDMLDIGANIGAMTAVMAMSRPNYKVYSFEPIPENLAVLKKVVRHYQLKNVEIFETALGNEDGSCQMIRPLVSEVKLHGLSHVYDEKNNPQQESGNIFDVALHKLDSIKQIQELSSISMIKIDVENFELEVLKGAFNTIQKHRPYIYCELWDNEIRTSCIQLLESLGYQTFMIKNGELIPTKDLDDCNFIFIPSSKNV